MSKKTKDLLWKVFAIVLVTVCGAWFMVGDVKHVEDTNGPDVYTLQTITDSNIIKKDMGALNVKESRSILGGGTVTYSSERFTGVYELYTSNIIATSLEVTVNHARVDKGNFRIVLLLDDEIVHEFKLNELTQSVTLEDVRGTVALRIAGESANFLLDYHVSE